MDAGHREELSRWASVLAQSSDAQTAAAGRAIQSLCAANEAGIPVERGELMSLAKTLKDAKAAERRAAARAIRSLCDENAELEPRTQTSQPGLATASRRSASAGSSCRPRSGRRR